MITLFGTIAGLLSSFLPEVMRMFQDKSDKKFEIEVMKLQMDHAKQQHQQRLTEINVQADISESRALYKHASRDSGNKFVEALRGSVRPIITYLFFAAFLGVKITVMVYWIQQDILTAPELIDKLWDEETAALFSAIIGFWFGQRAIKANRNK
jgi:hypothetical protein